MTTTQPRNGLTGVSAMLAILAAISCPLARAQAPEAQPGAFDLGKIWQDGIRLEWLDEQSSFRLGGFIQGDGGWINAPSLQDHVSGPLQNTAQVRRARLYVTGQWLKFLDYKLEGDLATGDMVLKDAYLRANGLPVLGSVTAGHFKEPMSLQQLTSATNLTFLERALPDVFAPARNFGVMASNAVLNKRATWAVGGFQNTEKEWAGTPDQGNAWSVTGRATWLPYYADAGGELVHLGASYSFRRPEDSIRFRQRPEIHFEPFFTDTGSLDADHVQLLGAEAAWVKGPFSMQGEYLSSAVDASTPGDLWFDGGYIQAGYFLTGETRPYDKRRGVFERVKPIKNFLCNGGWGAWEVAGRYSFLDLGSAGLPSSAQNLQDLTAGLNWYLNPNVTVMFNYVTSWVDVNGHWDPANIYAIRVQIAF